MEVFRIAGEALRRHKLRTFLTLLGVIIGVATVVSVASIIAGLNNYISERVFQLNPDVFIATQFGIITSRDEFLAAVRRKKIDQHDVNALMESCSRCEVIGVGVGTRLPVRIGNRRLSGVTIRAGTANMAELNNLDLEAGRFFIPAEDRHSAPVAIIGADIRQELFGRLDPIGKTIQVGPTRLKVIGLVKKQGSVLGQSQDNVLYLPLNTYQKSMGSRRSLDIFIKAAGGVPGVPKALDQVRTILRNRRHTPFRADDPFGIVSAEALQRVWKNISSAAFAVMLLISGISLVVGGIVIMNIMLVSVVERTREIGIRMAMGARRKDIRRQFLAEAVLLSLVGGVIGFGLGWIISKLIEVISPLPTLVRPELVAVALGVAVITGTLAGFFPARRAAALPPVEALRWE